MKTNKNTIDTNNFFKYFGPSRKHAEWLIMSYPVELREDVMYCFIKTVEERKYWLNVELSLLNRMVVTNAELDDPNEYESTIEKLILLAFLDNKITGYFSAVTHTQIVY